MPTHATLTDGRVSAAQLPEGLRGFTFPVGYIWISTVSTNPNTVLGYGTWVAFGAGRVLVGLNGEDTDFDTAEETGGAKTVQSSAQTFGGTALGTHQHDAITAGTVDAHAAHTHAYTDVVNHVHVQNMPSGFTGSQAYLATDTSTTGSTASAIKTANPDGGVASGTTGNPSASLTHAALGTHQHAAITAGTPAGTNTPGAATSVVQPYIVVYMFKRTA